MSAVLRSRLKLGLGCLAIIVLSSGGWVRASAAAEQPPTTITYNPVVIAAPDRGDDISLRITAPLNGANLPIVLFSHGSSYSKDDYQPLADYWAAHGFIVIQPTHLDSKSIGLSSSDPRRAMIWRWRVRDLSMVLDSIDTIEAEAPGLKGRMNRTHAVVAGHSYGGHTAAVLFGARVKDPQTGAYVSLLDRRIVGALLLAPPGMGEDADLLPEWRIKAPYLKVDWSTMKGPVLVVVGRNDEGGVTMTSRDWAWHADAYSRSAPGVGCLVVLPNAKHYMGGILGSHRTEVVDEDPVRVEKVQEMTTAFLHTAIDPSDTSWPNMKSKMNVDQPYINKIQCK